MMPMQHMPVPEPTPPSSKSSPAFFSASRTSSSVTCMPRISLSTPSLHSVTTQFTVQVVTPMSSLSASIYLSDALSAVPTLNVLVMMIGDSIFPSSSICTRPALLPNPLITDTPAATLSLNRFPSWGRIAVTPVWISFSSSCSVTCPTFTPGTSVIRFLFPFGYLL